MKPLTYIKRGNSHPFDESDSWWSDEPQKPSKPKDWAHAAARGIIANLQGRQGIKHELYEGNIDEATRREIVNEIAAIIRAGARLKP